MSTGRRLSLRVRASSCWPAGCADDKRKAGAMARGKAGGAPAHDANEELAVVRARVMGIVCAGADGVHRGFRARDGDEPRGWSRWGARCRGVAGREKAIGGGR